MQDDGTDPPVTFEATYERLKRVIEELEQGPLPLDTAIARYEEGMRLARLCDAILDQAELRIRNILRDNDGESGLH